MSTQTVYFDNPATITALQSNVSGLQTNTQQLQGNFVNSANLYGKFLHGVGSGDPSSSTTSTSATIVISTCLTVDNHLNLARIPVRYVIGTSLTGSFSDPSSEPASIVQSGYLMATQYSDYTVKVRLTGLTINTTYYYKFYSYVPGSLSQANQQSLITNRAQNEYLNPYDKSPVGRFKTMPASNGVVSDVRLAAINCQTQAFSWFNHCYQMSQLSKAGKLDYVLICGDYLYTDQISSRLETSGDKPFLDENGNLVFATTYNGYCSCYRAQKIDPDFQEMSRSISIIPMYNDHEVRNDWMVNPVNKDEIAFVSGNYNYNSTGTSYVSSQIPLEDTRGLLRTSLRAYYDHLPVWGLTSIGGLSTNGSFTFSTGAGMTPLDRQYKFGNLVSVHLLDDSAQNYYNEEDMNPFFTYTGSSYNSARINFNTYLIPNTGSATSIAFPRLLNFTGATGAFKDAIKPYLLWQERMLATRQAVQNSQLTKLYNDMTGSNCQWRVVLSGYKKNYLPIASLSDGLLPTNMGTDSNTGPKYPSTAQTGTLNFIFSDFPYNGMAISGSMPTSELRQTLPLVCEAWRELYATGAVSTNYCRVIGTNYQASQRTADDVSNILKQFKNNILVAGDTHDIEISHIHSKESLNTLFNAGRDVNGMWNTYLTSTGSVDISTNPIVSTLITPMGNSNMFPAYLPQSWEEALVHNGSLQLKKYQCPQFVDYCDLSLINGKGFTYMTITSTGADIKNLFVGGYDVSLTNQEVRNIGTISRNRDNIFNGISRREDKLQICSEYVIPTNTSSVIGNLPVQIIKPLPTWVDYIPTGYYGKIPVNVTNSTQYVNYNTTITPSQL